MIVLMLIFLHLLINFYVIPNLKSRKQKFIGYLVHFILASLSLLIYLLQSISYKLENLFCLLVLPAILVVLFNFLIHLITTVKIKLGGVNSRLYLFIIQEILHIISILVISNWLLDINSMELIKKVLIILDFKKGVTPTISLINIILFLAIMFVLATKITGHVINFIVGNSPSQHNNFDAKHTFGNQWEHDKEKGTHVKNAKITEEFVYSYMIIEKHEVSRSVFIGYMERLLVIVLTIVNAYPAIGFVVAAKSLARFKQLDNRDWAEYFLLGTLISMFLGIIYGIVIKVVLNSFWY